MWIDISVKPPNGLHVVASPDLEIPVEAQFTDGRWTQPNGEPFPFRVTHYGSTIISSPIAQYRSP